MQQRVMIVGLGLIGGSLALAIKQQQPEIQLIGWDHSATTRQTALQKQLIQEVPTDFSDGAQSADIIILAVPVKTTLQYLDILATLPLKPNVLVTDVGSTKQEIMAHAARLPFTFVGGHPMAGSHKSGVNAATADLFENAYFILTPQKDQTAETALLQELYQGTKAKFVILSAAEHDQITGMLSHIPHILAADLVNQADAFSQEHPRAKQLAAGGFRDITRIASSDPTMWTDILLSNREVLLDQIAIWQKSIASVADWLTSSDREAIYRFFDQAKEHRDNLPVHQNGAIPAFYDLLIDIPDIPGAIAEVTNIFAQEKLSIINLKIQETREDINGILQISFKNQKDLLRGQELIENQTNYQCQLK